MHLTVYYVLVLAVCTDEPPKFFKELEPVLELKFDPTDLLLTPLCVNFSQLVEPRFIKITETALSNPTHPEFLAILNAVQLLDAFNHSVSYVLPAKVMQQLEKAKPGLNDLSQLPFLSSVNRSALLMEAVLTLNKTYGPVFSPVPDCCSSLHDPMLSGKALILNCPSNAEKITWYKDGYLHPVSSVRHQVLTDGSLHINSLLPIDNGLYTCVARSGCAQNSMSTFLTIGGTIVLSVCTDYVLSLVSFYYSVLPPKSNHSSSISCLP